MTSPSLPLRSSRISSVLGFSVALLALVAASGCSQEPLFNDGSGGGGDGGQTSGANRGGGTDTIGGLGGGVGDGSGSGSGSSSGNGNVCESFELDTAVTPPRVLIVQDLSSSLIGSWDPLSDAMVAVVDEYGARMALGMVPFSSVYLDNVDSIDAMSDSEFNTFFGNNDNDCGISAESVIAPAAGTAAGIKAAYESVHEDRMVGGTPTNLAMTTAREILIDGDPQDGSEPILVLVTDGAPNCASGSSAERRAAVQDKIAALLSDGVETHVVGYSGGGQNVDWATAWATAGGTSFHDATDGSTLLSSMQEILADLVPCDYELSQPVSDPDYVRVTVDGEDRPLEATDEGWTLSDDSRTIQLGAQVCATLQEPGDHSIDVQVECEKVVIRVK